MSLNLQQPKYEAPINRDGKNEEYHALFETYQKGVGHSDQNRVEYYLEEWLYDYDEQRITITTPFGSIDAEAISESLMEVIEKEIPKRDRVEHFFRLQLEINFIDGVQTIDAEVSFYDSAYSMADRRQIGFAKTTIFNSSKKIQDEPNILCP